VKRRIARLVVLVLLTLPAGCRVRHDPSPIPTPPSPSPAPPTRWVAPTLPPPTATPLRLETPTPTAGAVEPTVTSPVGPAALPPTSAPVSVWEGTVTLNTYRWEEALVPTQPDDAAYPYPRLDFDAVSDPVPRTYRAVYLQNQYVRLLVLPDLGGRILRWTDRTTDRQLLYANPVIKPTHWGYRGWWLATGGIEWAFPTNEHGLNEYRPWSHELLWDGVRVWDTDDRTGLTVEVTVRLEAGSSRVIVSPRISNPTDRPQFFQFWTNAMLTLSDSNAPSPDLTFVLPASEVVVHSTADGSLPEPGGAMSWPVHAGRDWSRFPEWQSYLGVFAPQAAAAGFAGAYDLGTDQGIVRVAPAWVQGIKIFCLGDLGSGLWTDDGSRYFELWGGLTPTFWDDATLEPGESTAWTEYWYAVSGMGGCSFANQQGAARLTPARDGIEVSVQMARPVQATIVLRQGEGEASRWMAEIGPGCPFRATGSPGGGSWALEVRDAEGTVLLQGELSR
jgi:hypothetical protein